MVILYHAKTLLQAKYKQIREPQMKITGTFLDEISHDIPSQNWGVKEWERDFRVMQGAGIDTVILIRCGYKRWMTYPSEVLQKERRGFAPPADLVRLFLDLSEKYGMSFYFGTYDSGEYWHQGQHEKERDINRRVVDEVWRKYGGSPAFKGWYLSQEVSRNVLGIIDIYTSIGRHCKEISNGLPVLISPFIEGIKAKLVLSDGITPEQHEQEWNEIMAGIRGAVDIVAFQDGHVDFSELAEFLEINKRLADRYGLRCWTNSETFDRDMPIRFLPIKWEKLRLKLQGARAAGLEKAITFEFSHFLSPHSCYSQAKGLFGRYCEEFGIRAEEGD
jgi:hypothetical protein